MDASAQRAIDDVWVSAAGRLGIPVQRDDAFGYVHWDGRALHIATDGELDADDTVAQLVLHEICHALTQGPTHLRQGDWGLDNTTNDDEAKEHAALRLQAHLLGAYALRDLLFPTTAVKPFYLALPPAAGGGPLDGPSLLGPGDPSSPMARLAAQRAAARPWCTVLAGALDETARLAGRARHPTGAVLSPDDRLRCGDCAFRSDGGLCRKAPRRQFVAPGERACARHEPQPDCFTCAACCRGAYDTVIVAPGARVARTHPWLIERVDGLVRLRRATSQGTSAGAAEDNRCAALAGDTGGPWRCTVYDDRPATCRQFTRSGRHCLDARRKVGLSA